MEVCSLSSIGRKAYLGPRPALSAPCHYHLCLPTDTPDSRLNLILCLCVCLQKVRIPYTESCQSSGFLLGKLRTFASIDFSSSASMWHFCTLIVLCSMKRGVGKYTPNATARNWGTVHFEVRELGEKFEGWAPLIKPSASGPDFELFLYTLPLHNGPKGREVRDTYRLVQRYSCHQSFVNGVNVCVCHGHSSWPLCNT